MATYTDDFNRSDGALGGNWTQLSWSDASASISGNEVEGSGSGNAFYRWSGDGTWGREQYSEFTVGAAGGSDRSGPCVYMSDGGGCYYLRVRGTTSTRQIMKVPSTGGDGTQLVSNSASTSLTAGDVVRLKAEDDGSGNTRLTITTNGVDEHSIVDSSSPITSGDPGWCLEEFWRVTLDSWEGDDFAAAATETVTATVTDASGTTLPNETGIDWYWADSFGGTVTDSGSGETTDASGVLVVDVPNTTLSTGQFGYLRIRLSNGDVGIARQAID